MQRTFFRHLVPLFITLLPFGVVHAAMYKNPVIYGGITTIPQFLLALVDLVFLIGTPIIVVFIVYSGFLFVTGGDNETKVAKAKFVFMWTMIGGMVLLGAKAIALAIEGTVLSLK